MNRLSLSIILILSTVACKSEKKPDAAPAAKGTADTGSAPAPATGSGSGSTPTTAPAAPAAAAPPAAGALVITNKGLGALEGFGKITGDDQQRVAAVNKAFASSGLTADLAVMELGGEEETEHGYISVKKGETEVLQIVEMEGDLEVHALDPMFASADGIKTGDSVSVLGEKRKDAKCTAKKNNRIGYLTCVSASEPSVTFVVEATGYKGKASDAGIPVELSTISSRKLFKIVHVAPIAP